MNIIFDWSGTLLDDANYTYRCTKETVKHFGGPSISESYYKKNFCIPVDTFYKPLCPNTDIQIIDNHFFKCYSKSILQENFFEEIEAMIKQLAQKNRLFILSTIEEQCIHEKLEQAGLNTYFEGVYGNAFNKNKVLPKLLLNHELIPFETVFIGDMPSDIRAAKASSVQAAAVTYGYAGYEQLIEVEPDYFFDNATAITQHFVKMNQSETSRWPIATVGGLIFNPQNEVLLIKTDKWSGLYGTPGGKIDYGESMENAFKREVREETGLEITEINFISINDCIYHPEFYKKRHYLLINYTACITKTQEVALNYESSDYCWVTLEEAVKLPLNQPTYRLIQEVNAQKNKLNERNYSRK
jgi:phosphoglycolate phosphatase